MEARRAIWYRAEIQKYRKNALLRRRSPAHARKSSPRAIKLSVDGGGGGPDRHLNAAPYHARVIFPCFFYPSFIFRFIDRSPPPYIGRGAQQVCQVCAPHSACVCGKRKAPRSPRNKLPPRLCSFRMVCTPGKNDEYSRSKRRERERERVRSPLDINFSSATLIYAVYFRCAPVSRARARSAAPLYCEIIPIGPAIADVSSAKRERERGRGGCVSLFFLLVPR